MEELETLRRHIESGDLNGALAVLDEMEAMSKEDKINRVRSYLVVLLMHLIKESIEQRTTRSWQNSIRLALHQIEHHNKRRKAGGYYVPAEDMPQLVAEAMETAIIAASTEVLDGTLSPEEVEARIDRGALVAQALLSLSRQFKHE
jgi:hypothetical protein